MHYISSVLKQLHENFMVFHNVFVTFVGLKIVTMQNIEFVSVLSDRYTHPPDNASIETIPIPNIGSAHP